MEKLQDKPVYRTALVKQPVVNGPGVYAITNDDFVLYVGSTISLRKRLNHHRHLLLWGKHKNSLLQSEYEKRSESMDFIVLELTDNLIEREIYYMNRLNPFCNIDIPKDESSFGASEETRKKQSDAKRGIIPWNKGVGRTKAEIIAISDGIKKHNPNGRVPWNLGIPHTQEAKLKISLSKTGVKHV